MSKIKGKTHYCYNYKDEILVRRLPVYEVKNPPIINKVPAPNSKTQTKDAKRGLKLKKSISFCGGRGSFDNHE